jgi:hypothetical protein
MHYSTIVLLAIQIYREERRETTKGRLGFLPKVIAPTYINISSGHLSSDVALLTNLLIHLKTNPLYVCHKKPPSQDCPHFINIFSGHLSSNVTLLTNLSVLAVNCT